MPSDEPQPGPSGYTGGSKKDDKKNDKSKNQNVVVVEKRRKHHHRPRFQQDSQQQHKRRSSYDITLRYKIQPRQEGTQQSHSVRRLVAAPPRPPSRDRTREKETRYVVHQPELSRKSHHHLDAVDFYYRSTPYGHRHRDGLNKLRHRTFREGQTTRILVPSTGTSRLHLNRCRNCLELLSNCVCVLKIDRPATSDWTTLFRSHPERPRGFVQPRGNWLVDLEEKSKIDPEKIAQEKFNSEREICCFPFSTFKIFSKRDIEVVDFYRKNNTENSPRGSFSTQRLPK